MASLVTHKPISASGKPSPAWADALGWTLVFAIVLPIPIWAICAIVHRFLLRHHNDPIKVYIVLNIIIKVDLSSKVGISNFCFVYVICLSIT